MPTTPIRIRPLLLAATLGALALTAGGCKKSESTKKPKGLGTAVASTAARGLVATPDGKALAFVGEVAPPPEKNAPEGVLQGILTTVVADGSAAPRQLGGGVTTLEDGFRLSPDGKWIAWLQGFRFRDQSGTLQLAGMPTGEPRTLGEKVTHYVFSADSRFLGYVADGEARAVELASGGELQLASGAVTLELSPTSAFALVRRPIGAGGELLLVELGAAPKVRKLGERVGDYNFSPDGRSLAFTARLGGPEDHYSLFVGGIDGVPAKVTEKAGSFAFSPDSGSIAFVSGQEPGRSLGALLAGPVAGGAPVKLGENVADYRWSPDSRALALRENHEDKAGKQWTAFKVVQLPRGTVRLERKGKPKTFINYLWNPDGSGVAYLEHSADGLMLNLLTLAGEAPPRPIAPWVFGYQFVPGRKELWYRSACVREGRECELLGASLEDAARPPEKLAAGVANFQPSADGKRVLLAYPRLDTVNAFDLGWLALDTQAPSKGVDLYTLAGAVFLDPQGTRVAYVVSDHKREGVYVAELK